MGNLVYGDDLYATSSDVQGLGSEYSIPAAYLANINHVIKRASALVDMQTRSHFGKTPMVLELSGDGTPVLLTSEVTTWPIVSVSEVLEREDYEDTWADSSVETIESKYWSISRSRQALLMLGELSSSSTSSRTLSSLTVWTKGHKNYRVTGYFGRKTIPEIIKWATVLLAREAMSPGWIASNIESGMYQSERFADGYSYVRAVAAPSLKTTHVGSTTGSVFVDAMLVGFAGSRPGIIVPGGLPLKY